MIQHEEKEIRRLARLYWEGRIPLKEEAILFEFISAGDVNRKKYGLWEKEWQQSQDKNMEINRKWKRLQNRMQIRKNTSPEIVFKRRVPLWKKLSAAAAIALLVLTTAVGVYNLSVHNNQKVFAVEVPKGEKCKLLLPDGSTVWVNAASKIEYTSGFNTNSRTVTLTGEAYFEVARQENKPFIVKLPDYDIEVKGTKFNVSSYAGEKYALTTLMEGAVTLHCGDKEYIMQPGEMMQLDLQTKQFNRHRINAAQYRSWTEDRIEYAEITLGELFNRLSRQYDVQLHIRPDVDINKTLSVVFNNRETIDEILYGISKVASIRYKRDHNNIYVSKHTVNNKLNIN
jgi:ferric-dicitrate binding protein FerR (iron transport regulator)